MLEGGDMKEKRGSTGTTKQAVSPSPHSIEEILKHIDPAPDEETERFVSAIYADRREPVEMSPAE